MRVLLVEDEEFIRDLFKRQLDLSGFSTDAFGTGNDGLAALGKNAYDLVLLDIMLPDINGLQILQNIRSNPTTKGIAVVLLTNLGQDAVIKQGFELGADGYLVKAAYTPDQIVQEVKNIMQKKQAQAQPQAPAVVGAPPVMPTPQASAPPPASVNLEPSGAIANPAAMPAASGVSSALNSAPASSDVVQAATATDTTAPETPETH